MMFLFKIQVIVSILRIAFLCISDQINTATHKKCHVTDNYDYEVHGVVQSITNTQLTYFFFCLQQGGTKIC